ncbi:ADP/ATP translocase 3-like [Talpa occidentalis]|uniref:ADP/ATP translocase 3-like n=1 Tax=Talpa occidentalis TaxID=50954 RepID=UPI00188E9D4F|nr:ADP/ATP translocase 3-like [Talpa occidentalis]
MAGRVVSFAKGFLADVTTTLSKTAAALNQRGKLLPQGQPASTHRPADMQLEGAVERTARIPKGQAHPPSFWRGTLVNLISDIPTRPFNFALKDKHWQLPGGHADQHAHSWRGVAGKSAALCLVYPLDFTRARLDASAGKSGTQREFKALSNCLVKTSKSDSIRGLYQGFDTPLQGTSVDHRAPPSAGHQPQLQGSTTYRVSPPTGHHCLQGTTIYRAPPSTGQYHLQVTTVYRALPFTGQHLQVTSVYRASPTPGQHLQVTTVYRASPSKGRHRLQGTSVYRASTVARTTEHAPRPQEHVRRGEPDDRPEGESRGQRGPPPLLHHAASRGDAVGPQSC